MFTEQNMGNPKKDNLDSFRKCKQIALRNGACEASASGLVSASPYLHLTTT